jgi:hypothetical protein
MGRRKKTETITSNVSEQPDIVHPGDCCGNYLATDESCMICEIAETCKDLTESFNGENYESK